MMNWIIKKLYTLVRITNRLFRRYRIAHAIRSRGGYVTKPSNLNIEGEFIFGDSLAHLQSSVFKLSKDLIDSIHEEGIVAYTS